MDVAQGAQAGRIAQGGQLPAGAFPRGGPGGRGGLMFLGPYGSIVMLVLLVLTYAVVAFSYWKFLSKAGLTPAIALLMLVPGVNLGVALWLSFAEWPALREVARLKELVATYEMRAAHAEAAASNEATSG